MLKQEGVNLSLHLVRRSAESPVCFSCLFRKGSPSPWCRAQSLEVEAWRVLRHWHLLHLSSSSCASLSSWPAILFRKLSFLGQIAGVPGPSLQAFSGRRSDTSSCQDVRPTVIGVWVLESGRDHAMGFPWSPKRERLSDSGSGTVRRHWRIKSQLLSAPASDEAPGSTGGPCLSITGAWRAFLRTH